MTLQIAKGGGFNQMFLELCFSVMLMMRGGVPIKCSWGHVFLINQMLMEG